MTESVSQRLTPVPPSCSRRQMIVTGFIRPLLVALIAVLAGCGANRLAGDRKVLNARPVGRSHANGLARRRSAQDPTGVNALRLCGKSKGVNASI